jgi:predicted PurR-regulated permease PerM
MKKAKQRSSGGQGHPSSKYLFILFFLAVLTLAILIVKPFLSTLIVSAIIAYVFYPVYTRFYKWTKMKGFSAAVLIIMLFLLSLIPVLIVTGELTRESYEVYQKAREVLLESSSFQVMCAEKGGVICGGYNLFSTASDKFGLDAHLAQGFSTVASSFVSKASDVILNIPGVLLHIFIALFAMYYMFVDGKRILQSIKSALPMRQEHSDRMMEHFNEIIHATIYGAIVIGILQGILATIGYYIFGVSSPLILGLLSIIAAFIPFIGVALVWLPVSLSMLINGLIAQDSSLMWKAGGLALYCVLFVSTIDNFLRPKIVGARAKVHPLVILLGVFGGLALFGFVGIMIGPLLLTLFIASLKIYEQEKKYIT